MFFSRPSAAVGINVNIYMNLPDEVIRRFEMNCHQYVDKAHLCFTSDAKRPVDNLNQWLETVRGSVRIIKRQTSACSRYCGSFVGASWTDCVSPVGEIMITSNDSQLLSVSNYELLKPCMG